MIGNIARLIPVLSLGVILIAGCGKNLVTEDLVEQAPPDGSMSAGKAETVPDEGIVSEDVTAEDILSTADARRGGSYLSLHDGDELTKRASEMGHLYTIYFDYDKYTVRDTDMDHLTTNAKWLGLNSRIAIRIEGHADERGETDYNLALGDKRARSVRKYLEDLGIKADRMDVVSYGEEKPAMNGNGESAWAKNRRAEFVIVSN